jgi:hypothetical protein
LVVGIDDNDGDDDGSAQASDSPPGGGGSITWPALFALTMLVALARRQGRRPRHC